MPYYIRAFSKVSEPLSLAEIQRCLPAGVEAELASGSPAIWESILLQSKNGDAIGLLERADPDLLQSETEEFIHELQNVRPQSGAAWVSDYLRHVRQLISLQLLTAAFGEEFGSAPAETMWNIKLRLQDAIIQSDGEGFTNLEGYGVVWQFADNVTGNWSMAILDEYGRWHPFTMDLGSKTQRTEFLEGRVPSQATPI